ncbi:hypothetical protein M0802_003880 [Mischocyttarus mexicanus]|nr:hypothetical protein M0802_003880 [Mischocyttarus mexicanus]
MAGQEAVMREARWYFYRSKYSFEKNKEEEEEKEEENKNLMDVRIDELKDGTIRWCIRLFDGFLTLEGFNPRVVVGRNAEARDVPFKVNGIRLSERKRS